MGEANAYLLRPMSPLTTTPVWNVKGTPVEAGGLGIRRRKGTAPTYIISGTFRCATIAEAAALVTYYNSKSGGLTKFTFTNPDDGVTYSCTFPNALPRRRQANFWTFFTITMRAVTA